MRKEKTTKQKRVRKIIFGILGTLLALTIIFAIVRGIMTSISVKENTELANSFQKVENPDAVIPQKDENGNWTFTTDRELKILHLTDIHIGGGWLSKEEDAKAINAVASMVTAEKPDLVIVTGDISFPVPLIAGTLNNLNSARIFAELMETLGVPWIPTFGNHDTEAYSYYSREKVSDFYANSGFKHCLFTEDSDNIDGYGNSHINVKNSEGVVTHTLFAIDSHSYIDGDYFGIFWKYDKVHDNQVEWYKNTVKEINESNKTLLGDNFKPVTTLTFMHIPPREFKSGVNEYIDNGKKDTKNVKYLYGNIGEKNNNVYSSIYDDELFEAIAENGGESGIFCGHDHLNNASLEYNGVRLTYGLSIDYLAYPGIDEKYTQRGCTVITLNPDGSFENKAENYYQEKYQLINGTAEEITIVEN